MKSTGNDRRTWNNPTREPWNPVIKACLNAIDHHTRFYLSTGDEWHEAQAEILRNYISQLKGWIQTEERVK